MLTGISYEPIHLDQSTFFRIASMRAPHYKYCFDTIKTEPMSNKPTLSVNKFSIDKIKEKSSVLIIGKRGSGVRHLIKHIINTKGWTDVATAISPRDGIDPFFSDCGMKVHHSIPDTLLDNKVDLDQHNVVVLDDCITTGSVRAYNELLLNARHYNTTLIVNMQYPISITPEVRLSFDYVFLFRDSTCSNQKRIWDNYAGCFPTLSSFKKVFAVTTEGHKSMVIDMGVADVFSISRNVFWYEHTISADNAVTVVLDTATDGAVTVVLDNECEIPQESDIVSVVDATPDTTDTTDTTPDTIADSGYSCSLM